MNEFEQWFAKHHPAKYPDNNPAISAAEIADDCWGNSESVARAIREEIG